MLFPIGDDQVKGGYYPFFSYAFIVLNTLVFLYQSTLSVPAFETFVMTYGAVPAEVMQGGHFLTLFTSMFLHGSWLHLIGNMVFLWIFADNIEATIGSFRFLLFYFIGGLAAHAGHIYFNLGSEIPTVGASGAIAAVMGGYLILFPSSKIKMLFIFFIIRIPDFVFLLFWIIQQVTLGNADLQAVPVATAGVAWWAHIAGFAYGVIAGFYYRLNYPRPTDGALVLDPPRYRRDDLL